MLEQPAWSQGRLKWATDAKDDAWAARYLRTMSTGAEPLPAYLEGPGGLVVRRWTPADAEVLGRAVAESGDHLQPWMPWIADEPMTLEARRAMLAGWEREWLDGGDVMLGVFVHGQIAGSTGLHRRIAEDGVEIGYWIHPAFTRKGVATRAVRLLTQAALSLPDITHVEIHHDKANTASAGIPRKLGYRLIDETTPDTPAAPRDVGVDGRWRIDKDAWRDMRRDA